MEGRGKHCSNSSVAMSDSKPNSIGSDAEVSLPWLFSDWQQVLQEEKPQVVLDWQLEDSTAPAAAPSPEAEAPRPQAPPPATPVVEQPRARVRAGTSNDDPAARTIIDAIPESLLAANAPAEPAGLKLAPMVESVVPPQPPPTPVPPTPQVSAPPIETPVPPQPAEQVPAVPAVPSAETPAPVGSAATSGTPPPFDLEVRLHAADDLFKPVTPRAPIAPFETPFETPSDDASGDTGKPRLIESRPTRPMMKIEIRSFGNSEQRTLSQETVLGRHDPNKGIRPDISLANDTQVSRRHIRFFPGKTGGFMLGDLNSTNGTHYNGRKLDKGQEVALTVGDTVVLGQDTLIRILEIGVIE